MKMSTFPISQLLIDSSLIQLISIGDDIIIDSPLCNTNLAFCEIKAWEDIPDELQQLKKKLLLHLREIECGVMPQYYSATGEFYEWFNVVPNKELIDRYILGRYMFLNELTQEQAKRKITKKDQADLFDWAIEKVSKREFYTNLLNSSGNQIFI